MIGQSLWCARALCVCCCISSWQVLVSAYLLEPELLWGAGWYYDYHSRQDLEGAHAIVIEGVLQQEQHCHFAADMSKALTGSLVLVVAVDVLTTSADEACSAA